MSERQTKQRRASGLNALARKLRHEQTKVEQKLWRVLRDRQLEGAKFRRQMPVGPYIVDFACPIGRLVIELDGGQHADQQAYDEARSRLLATQGYRVLRFWNNEVAENLEGVTETIRAALRT